MPFVRPPLRRIAGVAFTLSALCFGAGRGAAQSYIWNGPLTGTPNWSTGAWSPVAPPAGGASGTTLTFTQLGNGAYTANNDLGPSFQLTTLNFASAGGGITVGSNVGNTLEFVGAAGINVSGIGVQILSSTATLTATNTSITGAGLGNLTLSGILSGPGGITINRPQSQFFTGIVNLTAANTFAGGVTLQAGNLRVGNATALGSGTLTVNGGTLGASAASVVANAVTLNANLVYSGFANLTLTGVISETGGARGLRVSSMTGNTLILQGANTYTGPTVVEVNPNISTNVFSIGLLTLNGTNGSATNSSSFTIGGGSTLTLDNSVAGANNNNRIGDAAGINLSNATLIFNGGQAGATLENVGPIVGQGFSTITLNASAAGNTGTTIQADSLARATNRGQFLFRSTTANFGAALGANIANMRFDAAPAMVGGGGAAGTTTMSILTYAIGEIPSIDPLDPVTPHTGFVTHAANGIRLLTPAEYSPSITIGATSTNNVFVESIIPVTTPTTINSLKTGIGTPFTGSSSTLTVTSGSVLVVTAPNEFPFGMTLGFGAAEGNLTNLVTVNMMAALSGSNGMTKGGAATLTLASTTSTITGTLTINRGLIAMTDAAAIGSFTDIRINGLSSTTPPGLSFPSGSGGITINKTITVTDGFVHFSAAAGSTLTISGQITGSGGVFLGNTGAVALTNVNNNYTGQTRIFNGNLLIGSDAVLGNGGGVDFGALATAGLRLTGNWTTARAINFSTSNQVDTNGFAWTVNSPVTGTGPTINKIGAGAWVLTQGGSLGQSLAVATTGTTTTINVNAGELRVTNPTGSATGSSIVTVANTAPPSSGTGRIAGATTVAATAFASPGVAGGGTLSFDSTLALNGTFRMDSAADRIDVAGALTLGAASNLDLTGASLTPGSAYTIMSFSSVTGLFATNNVPLTHALSYGPTTLTLVPVPEPGLILFTVGTGLVGYRFVRRRMSGVHATA